MGYQVGFVCHETKEAAEAVYFSKVVPFVNQSGLYQPVRHSDGWYFQRVKLSAGLPECVPAASFADGAQLGMMLLIPLALAWGITVMRRVLR